MVAFGRVRVCRECIERVGPQVDVLCVRCGDALGMESARFAAAMGLSECTMCRLAPPEFERAVAFANYDNEMREMLHLLKFGGQRRMAEHVLGERMAAAMLKLHAEAANDLLVVPVPLFAAKERERGFNQSRLLAEAAVKRLRKSAPEWKLTVAATALQRVKDTRAMFTLDPSQRRRNLRGAFRIGAPNMVQGREVLLIDDIMTTGATARECSRVLRRAGATKVWVATAAKAQPASATAKFETNDVALWQPATAARSSALIEPNADARMSF
jgi:ComF family protein